jgi:3-dehydroquinate synthase
MIADVNIVQAKPMAAAIGAELIVWKASEAAKTRATKEQLEDVLIEKGYQRNALIIALGGGVTTDLVGFLASTYMRGISLVLIPTTLLAMVDAAIGGKTGVNTPLGKNLIGTYYEPTMIYIDTRFLDTLPEVEWINGLAEVAKYGLACDQSIWDQLSLIPLVIEESVPGGVGFSADSLSSLAAVRSRARPLAPDRESTEASLPVSRFFNPLRYRPDRRVIEACIRAKLRVTSADYREQGLRRVLNFGHTIAHAIEAVSNYTIPHGTAVAMGCIAETKVSTALGYLAPTTCDAIVKRFTQLHLPTDLPYDIDQLIEKARYDKKGSLRFVCIDEIGHAVPFGGSYVREVDLTCLTSIFAPAK